MNERIKALVEQARKYADENRPGSFVKYDPEWFVLYNEKFAELIVRECALVAKTLPHTPERHWVQDSVTYIPVHCEQNILKHFGVEE
jgi:hypothetical protein